MTPPFSAQGAPGSDGTPGGKGSPVSISMQYITSHTNFSLSFIYVVSLFMADDLQWCFVGCCWYCWRSWFPRYPRTRWTRWPVWCSWPQGKQCMYTAFDQDCIQSIVMFQCFQDCRYAVFSFERCDLRLDAEQIFAPVCSLISRCYYPKISLVIGSQN